MCPDRHIISRRSRESGFTLVEIALVVLVIGILIGGLLLGQEVLRNARLKAVYVKTGIFASAIEEFTRKYDALPGDMIDATARITGCTGGCGNGGGDSIIGNATQAIFTAAAPGDETTMAWYHLQAAALINDVTIGAAPAATDPWGQSLPAAPGSGGFQLRTMGGQFQDDSENITGIFLRWQLAPFIAADSAAGFVATPADAAQIDRKFDDGAPLHGAVRARGTDPGIAADGCKASATTYNETGGQIACYMYFRIREAPAL